jgi:hypothetical protein
MFQFSLRNLLVAVSAVAVGTAALLNANSWWASLLWGAALLMLAFAGLMAFLRREAKRAYWSSYVAAGSLYLLLLVYSVPQYSQSNTWMPYGPLNHDNLATTKVIHWAYSLLPTSKRTPTLPNQPGGTGSLMQLSVTMMGGQTVPSGQTVPNGVTTLGFGPSFGAPSNPGYIDPEVFTQVGQALWMFFLSWLGGTIAFLLFRSRERPSPLPVTSP